MSVQVSRGGSLFTLHTRSTTYQFGNDKLGFPCHYYYGTRVENTDLSYLLQPHDRGFSGNPYDFNEDRTISADTMPLEYSCRGNGDYREHCVEAEQADGSTSLDLRYSGYRIESGKKPLSGLPYFRGCSEDIQTLIVTLRDKVTNLEVELYYSVFEAADIITRHAKIVNVGEGTVMLKRALSACLDFAIQENRDFVSFYGRHAGERNIERTPLHHGKQTVDSTRGASSLHQNPFVILCDSAATEDSGSCYGMLFVYSGSFLAQAELDQINQTRLVMGIHPQNFCWQLKCGESFETPEVALCYSDSGFSKLSNRFHYGIDEYLIPDRFRNTRCPVLINNWEATYFNFDDKRLLAIAKQAKELGIELFVLDDGWFGKRDGDTSGLGDWYVNINKIRCGMPELSRQIHDIGMDFGLWIEPEMVSEDSDLFRAHPDWRLSIPGRAPVVSRRQYVLDYSREEVVEHIWQQLLALFSQTRIDYIKWDMNRNICDIFSATLPAGRQGEVLHRYMLGVYDLMERLTETFPNIRLETCSGGGGRFDAGMLYYSPQIWCSDNTDPIERLSIQYGTSFAYPQSTMGAHVSASPNHQTGRSTAISTRAVVAMAGTFGYELDPTALSETDKWEISTQVQFFKENWRLLSHGKYYRLTHDPHCSDICAWMNVAANGDAALSWVCKSTHANAPVNYLKLKGLEDNSLYHIEGTELTVSGSALMNAGIPINEPRGDYPAGIIIIKKT